MSDLELSVTLVAVLTTCVRPKVEQKLISVRPSGYNFLVWLMVGRKICVTKF